MPGTDKKTDEEEGDEILRRMLKTPPQPKEGEGSDSDANKKKEKPAD